MVVKNRTIVKSCIVEWLGAAGIGGWY